jgi:hypothetical protein
MRTRPLTNEELDAIVARRELLVCFRRQTGSDLPTSKPTRLTHCGSDRFEGRAPHTFVSFRSPLRSIEPLIAIVLDCRQWKRLMKCDGEKG